MEKNLDERMDEIAARIEETRRIRRGLYAHLGERIFNQVVADPGLRNGKEEIVGAIAACNRELGRLEDALASLDARLFATRQVSEPAHTMPAEPAPAPDIEIEVEVEDASVEPATLEAPAADAIVETVDASAADFPVTVAPVDPLAPAAAPEPVTLEPLSFDVEGAQAVGAPEVAEATDVAETVEAAADAEAMAEDVAAAPTIVLDRGDAPAPVVEPAEADADAGVRTCPVCGSVVAPDHRFCMNCGYRLAD